MEKKILDLNIIACTLLHYCHRHKTQCILSGNGNYVWAKLVHVAFFFLANWKILTRVHAAGYNLFVNMALKRLPYAADITVCLPRRSTFKLRGIVKNIHQLSAANPLSLVVSLDWCVNTFPGFAATTAEKVFCVVHHHHKKGGKTLHFFSP